MAAAAAASCSCVWCCSVYCQCITPPVIHVAFNGAAFNIRCSSLQHGASAMLLSPIISQSCASATNIDSKCSVQNSPLGIMHVVIRTLCSDTKTHGRTAVCNIQPAGKYNASFAGKYTISLAQRCTAVCSIPPTAAFTAQRLVDKASTACCTHLMGQCIHSRHVPGQRA